MALNEYLLTTNEYTQPMTIKDKDALAIILLRLLLMTPGTNPDHPEMGVDLVGRYRFAYEDDLRQANQEIEAQINQYLPQYQAVEVKCYKDKSEQKQLGVDITIDDTLFQFTTEPADKSGEKISLSSELNQF